MICCDIGPVRFQYRVAGVALRDGHVLLARDERTGVSFLPGGRVEAGESGEEALRREMLEESGAAVGVGRLIWIVENFFRLGGRGLQELCLFFALTLPPSFFSPGDTHRDANDGIALFWQPLAALDADPPRPAFLRTGLRALPLTCEHLVVRDP